MRDWVEKFENGEYLRKWNTYEPFILGCTAYSEYIDIGEEKESKIDTIISIKPK